jgi:hypothetical protein
MRVPDHSTIDAFRAELERHGVGATIRLSRGRDIDAGLRAVWGRGDDPAARSPQIVIGLVAGDRWPAPNRFTASAWNVY